MAVPCSALQPLTILPVRLAGKSYWVHALKEWHDDDCQAGIPLAQTGSPLL